MAEGAVIASLVGAIVALVGLITWGGRKIITVLSSEVRRGTQAQERGADAMEKLCHRLDEHTTQEEKNTDRLMEEIRAIARRNDRGVA